MKNLIAQLITAHNIRQVKHWKAKRKAENREYIRRRLGHV